MIQNIRILLADDDEDDQLFFQEAVAESEINAEYPAVESGLQLVDFLSDVQASPASDVIFLDINMPGMDGKTCLREIRKQAHFAETPVIVLSTSARIKDIDETYKGGANMYISKALFYMNTEKWVEKLFP
jgi:CheY-like chemotaxis protein